MAREKTCKRCEEKKSIASFVKSARSKDGYLGFCRECWSSKMKEGAKRKKKAKPKPSSDSKSRTKPDLANSIRLANEALSYANGTSMYIVEADDGDTFETANGQEALLKAVEWLADGYGVSVREEIPLSSLVMRLMK